MNGVRRDSRPPGTTGGWGRLQAAMLASKLARSAMHVLAWALLAYHPEQFAGIDPAVTQSVASLAVMLQLSRPLLAAGSDARPGRGHRRKPLLAAGNGLFVVAAALLLGGAGGTVAALVAVMLAWGAGDACQDVALDSWLLDEAGADPARKTRGQLVMRLGAVAGTVLGYGLGGLLVDVAWDAFVAVLLAACACSGVLGMLVPERPANPLAVKGGKDARQERPGAGAPGGRPPWLPVAVAMLVAVPFAADGLANGMLEPWLIDRIGAPAPTFFGAELAGSLVAMAAIGCLLAVPRWKRADPARLLVVLLPAAAWYYIAAGWLSPNLGWYLAWNAVQFSVAMLVGVALDRMLMDAVRGERRGTSFQAYGLAVQAGSLAGTFLGPLVAAGVGMDGVLLLAAGLLVATGVAYGAWLRPALRQALDREAATVPGPVLYPVPGW